MMAGRKPMDTVKSKLEIAVLKQAFSERLNYLLGYFNIDAACLALKTGISESMISRYCAGQCLPNYYNLYVIGKSLNVDLYFLMGFTEQLSFIGGQQPVFD